MKTKILAFVILLLAGLVFMRLNLADDKEEHQLSSASELRKGNGSSRDLPDAHLPGLSLLYQYNKKELATYLRNRDNKFKDYAILWEVIHSGKFKGSTKDSLLEDLIAAFFVDGEINDFLDFLYERKGPGSERAAYVGIAFAYSRASGSQKIAMLRELHHEDELESACQALYWPTVPLDITDFDLSRPVPNAINDLLLSTLSRSVGAQVESNRASVLKNYVAILEKKISDKIISEASLAEFLTMASGDSPFEVWNHLSEGAEEINQKITKKQRTEILKNMVLTEPQRALERLAEKTNYLGNDLVLAMGEWIKLDSRTALEWFKSKEFGDVELISDIQFSFANAALRNGEIDGALKWRDEIQGETRKEQINYQLWKVQRDKIAAETKSDPTQVFSSFLEGTSSYESYFLEEATTQWIKIAPAKAAEWVEENGSSLPENSFQYVAAAYAGASVDSNDLELARQWADLIQDEKTLTRINGIIEKAEQAVSD